VLGVIGVNPGNAKHQVAIGLDPDIDAEFAVPKGHRIERITGAGAVPDDVASVEILEGGGIAAGA